MNDRLGDIEDSIDDDGAEFEAVREAKESRARKKRKFSWGKIRKKIENDKRQQNATERPSRVEESLGDIELGKQPADEPRYMDSFFREVETIKTDIDTIKAAVNTVQEANEAMLLATNSEQENELSGRLQTLVNNTNKTAKQTKNRLTLLKEENTKLKDEGEIKQSDIRVRENLVNTLTRKFIDEVKLYQSAQQKHKDDIKQKATRQIRTIAPDATDEQIDAVIRSEGGWDALYKETILAGGVADPIRIAHAKVADKYQDVLTLERSLAELHQMFIDIALLTEQQGELLDQIEIHVKGAADEVDLGNADLVKSIEYQKGIRKKQCWIILIVVIVLIVVLLPNII